jgi:hypothetical protein
LGEGFMYVHLCFGIQKFERWSRLWLLM